MRSTWVSCVAGTLVAASSGTFASDLSRPVIAPPPAYNWTDGFYIGGNLGGAWARTTLNDNFTGGSVVGGVHSGFIGGAQIGYNWRLSPQFVLGIEWMFDGTDISSSGSRVGILNTLVQGSLHTDWVQTLAARLGYASNNWLLYGKIGGAWAQNSATATVTFADGTVASISGSDTNGGWTAGVGAEYGWIPNWTLKVEWDFVRLDNRNFGNLVNPLAAGLVDRFSAHRDIDMFTVGLNYKILSPYINPW